MSVIVAVVPAAGASRRMGRPKLLLPLGDRPIFEHVVAALDQSAVHHTIVVLPPGDRELSEIALRWGAEPIVLDEPTSDMRASLVRGLDHAEARNGARLHGFVLALADQPALQAATVDRLIDSFSRAMDKTGGSGRSIFIPTHEGRRGHPVLFAWKHAAEARRLELGQGLNRLVAKFAGEVVELPVDHPSVLEDIDTPDDYRRAGGASNQ